jgi:hypothetical protein
MWANRAKRDPSSTEALDATDILKSEKRKKPGKPPGFFISTRMTRNTPNAVQI